MSRPLLNQTLTLLPQDYLAVLTDLLLHSRETSDLLRATPGAATDIARLSCVGIGCDADFLTTRLRDFFGLGPDEARAGLATRAGLAAPLPATASFGEWAQTLHQATGGRPRHIGFLTSGSTGKPALGIVPFAALEQEVRIMAGQLPFQRVCSVMPRYHCFGFVYGVLLPRIAGAPQRAFMPLPTTELTDYLRPGDLLVGFPFFFDALVRISANLNGVMPLTAGSPCSASLADALLQAGADGVREIYGASELSAVGFRHIARQAEAEKTPFTLLPQWERRENTLIRRYEDNSESAPASLPDSLDWRTTEKGRSFTVLARHDKAVQVGGRNVYPDRVRGVLESHMAVACCRVRLMRPEEGWRLKAFVVPKGPLPDAKKAMRMRASLLAWCRERLPSESLPKAITIGAELPRNVYGKDTDWD